MANKKNNSFIKTLQSDPLFLEKIQKAATRNYSLIIRTLRKIIQGKENDYKAVCGSKCPYCNKKIPGAVVEIPVSQDVRVKAVRALKQISLDKFVPDSRYTGETDDKEKVDLAGALEKLSKKMIAQKKKEEDRKNGGKKENVFASPGPGPGN